jgi:hypothetical protein
MQATRGSRETGVYTYGYQFDYGPACVCVFAMQASPEAALGGFHL